MAHRIGVVQVFASQKAVTIPDALLPETLKGASLHAQAVDGSVVITPETEHCVFCRAISIATYHHRGVCIHCLQEMKGDNRGKRGRSQRRSR